MLTLVAVLATGGLASAGEYPVTTLADSGPGSLRKAIEEANTQPGTASTIPVEVSGTIGLTSALPVVEASIAVEGPG
jgi:hypothetical protein